MARTKLTKANVENLTATAGGRAELWDNQAAGFGVRATATTRSFFVMYRLGGKRCRYTIGTFPTWSVEDARKRAREVIRAVEDGADPAAEKKVRRTAPPAAEMTFEQFAGDFESKYLEHKVKDGSWYRGILKNHVLPQWKDRSFRSITRADVMDLIDDIERDGNPVLANRVLAIVRRMYNWAIDRGMTDANPCAGVKKQAKETPRERVLSSKELAALWPCLDNLGSPWGPYLKLLILTGQRRNEVAGMRWSEIDADAATWTIPGTRTKNGKTHTVHLSAPALAIIQSQPRFKNSPFVFPARGRGRHGGGDGETHITGFSAAKRRLDKMIDLPAWTFHDLRRSAASGMAELGIAVETISKVLNHSDAALMGITAIYNRHGYEAAKKAALDSWSRHVIGLTIPAESNVVELVGAR